MNTHISVWCSQVIYMKKTAIVICSMNWSQYIGCPWQNRISYPFKAPNDTPVFLWWLFLLWFYLLYYVLYSFSAIHIRYFYLFGLLYCVSRSSLFPLSIVYESRLFLFPLFTFWSCLWMLTYYNCHFWRLGIVSF